MPLTRATVRPLGATEVLSFPITQKDAQKWAVGPCALWCSELEATEPQGWHRACWGPRVPADVTVSLTQS